MPGTCQIKRVRWTCCSECPKSNKFGSGSWGPPPISSPATARTGFFLPKSMNLLGRKQRPCWAAAGFNVCDQRCPGKRSGTPRGPRVGIYLQRKSQPGHGRPWGGDLNPAKTAGTAQTGARAVEDCHNAKMSRIPAYEMGRETAIESVRKSAS